MLVTIHSNVEKRSARLGDGGWTIMTTNHPVPTPPPTEPAPSLRPVEEPCGFAIIDDGEVRPCERPATGWRWYQDCGHEDMLARACDWHENEGGRRLRAAEETLAAVGALAEEWRYKGEFGWGSWQEGHGPDESGYALDQASAELRAVLAEGASR